MPLIFRLIFRRLFFGTAFLSFILVTGVWLTQSLRFIEIIVNQNVSIAGYFSFVGYLIPDLLAIVLPICVLISTLVTYNKLITDHELIILRTCGLNDWRLAQPAVLLGLVAVIVVGLINIYIIPLSYKNFRDMEYKMRNEFSSGFIHEGTFNTLRGLTVYARSRNQNDELQSVFIHSSPHSNSAEKKQKPGYTIIADRGIMVSAPHTIQLVLFNGNRQELDPKTGKMTFFHFDRLNYDLTQIASPSEERVIKPVERPLRELLNADSIEGLSPSNRAKLRAEAHQRLLLPFLSLVFVLIATATLLRGDLNRGPRRQKIGIIMAGATLTQVLLMTMINLNGQFPNAIPLAYGLVALTLCLLINHLVGFFDFQTLKNLIRFSKNRILK